MRQTHFFPAAFLFLAAAFSAQAISQQLEPQNADRARAFRNQGVEAYDAGRFEDAVGKFKQAIRLKPDYAQAFNDLGMAYVALNRHGEAIEPFRQAVSVNP